MPRDGAVSGAPSSPAEAQSTQRKAVERTDKTNTEDRRQSVEVPSPSSGIRLPLKSRVPVCFRFFPRTRFLSSVSLCGEGLRRLHLYGKIVGFRFCVLVVILPLPLEVDPVFGSVDFFELGKAEVKSGAHAGKRPPDVEDGACCPLRFKPAAFCPPFPLEAVLKFIDTKKRHDGAGLKRGPVLRGAERRNIFRLDSHDLGKAHQEMEHIDNFDLAVLSPKSVVPHLPDQLGKFGGKRLAVVFDPDGSLFRIVHGRLEILACICQGLDIEFPLQRKYFPHPFLFHVLPFASSREKFPLQNISTRSPALQNTFLPLLPESESSGAPGWNL